MDPVESEFYKFYKSMLIIYHILGIAMLILSSPTVIKVGKYVWPYIPTIPFEILVGPIKVAAILYPAVPQFQRLNRIKFFLLHLFCVEFVCGAFVATQVYNYCITREEKCYKPQDPVNPREEDYTMTDFTLQTIITIYACCVTCLIKSVYKRVAYTIQKGYDWLQEYSLFLLILSNMLVILVDFDYNRSSFSFLVLNIVCEIVIANCPPVLVDRRRANIWLVIHQNQRRPIEEPNGWVINRYEIEPGEQPRANGWFADQDRAEVNEEVIDMHEPREEGHEGIQEMIEALNEENHQEPGDAVPLLIHME